MNYKMKFKDWIKVHVNPKDIICKCINPAGLDSDNVIYPLGCAHGYKSFTENNNINIFTNHPEANSELLFYSFSTKTDRRKKWQGNNLVIGKTLNDRAHFKSVLDKKYKMMTLPPNEYFKNIGKYKFTISPEGNGIDCYRHYEAWISKGIPIIERNTFIANKYQNLPILWTTDYSEINDDYLNRAYNYFLEQEYDFRRLLITQYQPNIQKQIITIMNAPKPDTYPVMFKNKLWNYSDYFSN